MDAPHETELMRHMGLMNSSVRLDEHLTKAIQEFTPPVHPAKDTKAMRGLSRLTNLTNSIVQAIDAQADQMANEIQSSHDRIQTAMNGFSQVNEQMKATAAEAEAALAQLTNVPPAS